MLSFFSVELRNENTRQLFKRNASIVSCALGSGVGEAIFGRPPSVWVARIVGISTKYGLEREFIAPFRDYSSANSKMSRGVYAFFFVSDSSPYEISIPWGDRWFAVFQNNNETRISREEVLCLIRQR